MAQRGRRIIRGGRQVRETIWLSLPAAFDTLATSGTAALSSSLNAGALALRPFTIVRTHINWVCLTDQSAASEFFVGNLGLAVVSDQAAAIGVTAVPTPATDLDSDLWFLHQSWMGEFAFGDATGFAQNDNNRNIDSKAMRKVNGDEDVVVVKEAGIGSSGVIVGTVGRMLVKLH